MLGQRPVTVGLGILLIAVTAVVFARGLNAPFVFDDVDGIEKNPHLRSLWPTLDQALGAPKDTPPFARPVVAYSLSLTYALWELDPRGYHLFNIVVHLLNTLLIYDLLRRTILTRVVREKLGIGQAAAAMLGFVAALLWSVHPLQTEAVTYASQRTELLFSCFLLLTLWAFVWTRTTGRRGRWWGLAVAACFLGMASKETMVVAPLIVLLYDRTFLSGTFYRALVSHWMVYLGLAATWYLLLILVISFWRAQSAGFHHGDQTGITVWTYLLTQANVIVHYLQQVLWPDRLSIDIEMRVAQTVADAIPNGLVVVSLMWLTLYGLIRRPALGFLGAWFFLILAPSSSVVPVVTELAAERRMYLPLLSPVIAAVLFVYRLSAIANRPHVVTATVCVPIAIALGIVSVVRLGVYESKISLYEDAVAKFPENTRALQNLGSWYVEAGQIDKGIERYEQVLQLEPDKLVVHHNLAVALKRSGQLERALEHFRIYHEAEPEDIETLNDYGSCFARLGRYNEAENKLREAIRVNPSYAPAYANLARVYHARKDYAAAERLMRQSLDLEPYDPIHRQDIAKRHNDLGAGLANQGQYAAAAEQFRAAVELDSDFEDARANLLRVGAMQLNALGVNLAKKGQYAAAIEQFRKALDVAPSFAPARKNLDHARKKLEEAQARSGTGVQDSGGPDAIDP